MPNHERVRFYSRNTSVLLLSSSIHHTTVKLFCVTVPATSVTTTQPRRYRKLKKERLNVPRSPSEPQLPREEVQNYDIRRERKKKNRKQQCHPRETRVIASKDEIGLYCNGPVGVTSCAFIKRDPCLGPLRDSLERKK
jgi:hypothetical protein